MPSVTADDVGSATVVRIGGQSGPMPDPLQVTPGSLATEPERRRHVMLEAWSVLRRLRDAKLPATHAHARSSVDLRDRGLRSDVRHGEPAVTAAAAGGLSLI